MPKLTAGENVTLTINVGADTLTVAVLTETVQDLVGALVVAGVGITATYDDGAGTLTIAATGPDLEAVYDAIGTVITAGSGVTKTVDDTANTVTLAIDSEFIRAIMAATLVPGTGLTVVEDDEANTLTISAPENLSAEEVQDLVGAMVVAAGGTYDDTAGTFVMPPASTDAETIRDTVAAALVAGANVTITASDAGDTITIEATGGGGTGLTDPTTTTGDLITVEVGATTNYALNSISGVSSTASGDYFNPSTNAFDNNPATHWAQNDTTAASWLRVDLGVAEEIGRLILTNTSYIHDNMNACELQSSEDDSAWSTRVEIDAILTAQTREFVFDEAPVTARYWRLYWPVGLGYQSVVAMELRSVPTKVVSRIPVGTDGQVLTADSGETLGVVWSAPAVQVVTANFVFPAILATQFVDVVIDFDYEIASVTILGDTTGSVVFNVARATYAAFPTFTDIDASAPPTLSSAQKSQDATLTGWTVAGAPGDVIRVTVVSTDTLTAATMSLKLTKV